MINSKTSIVSLVVLIACGSSYADTKTQVMFSKYLRYGFCMEKTFGQPWPEKAGIATVMNRWGTQEPTAQAIEAASPKIKAVDLQCRAANGITDEPRPVSQ
jgi:hypothetical protein